MGSKMIKLDKFRISEGDKFFTVQQQVEVIKFRWKIKGWKIVKVYDEPSWDWIENVYLGDVVWLTTEKCFYDGKFDNLKQAKKAVKLERKRQGFSKAKSKYHSI